MLGVDKSCNNAVAQKNAQRLLNQDDTVSSNPSGFWRAKERLSLELVKDLAKKTGQMLSRQACQEWNWQGHPIKLVDGTTITLPDTVE